MLPIMKSWPLTLDYNHLGKLSLHNFCQAISAFSSDVFFLSFRQFLLPRTLFFFCLLSIFLFFLYILDVIDKIQMLPVSAKRINHLQNGENISNISSTHNSPVRIGRQVDVFSWLMVLSRVDLWIGRDDWLSLLLFACDGNWHQKESILCACAKILGCDFSINIIFMMFQRCVSQISDLVFLHSMGSNRSNVTLLWFTTRSLQMGLTYVRHLCTVAGRCQTIWKFTVFCKRKKRWFCNGWFCNGWLSQRTLNSCASKESSAL